jgi:hypothetical protein
MYACMCMCTHTQPNLAGFRAMIAKRTRVASLGRGSHVTKAAVASLLRQLKDAGEIHDSCSRSTISKARKAATEIHTVYGSVVGTCRVVNADFGILRPIPLLSYLVKTCKPFAEYVRAVMRDQPPTHEKPWSPTLNPTRSGACSIYVLTTCTYSYISASKGRIPSWPGRSSYTGTRLCQETTWLTTTRGKSGPRIGHS